MSERTYDYKYPGDEKADDFEQLISSGRYTIQSIATRKGKEGSI